MKNTVNITAIEARDGRVGYNIQIFDFEGEIVQGVSGSITGRNPLVKTRFHLGGIYLPGTEYNSHMDTDWIAQIAQERGRSLERRADGAISIDDGVSNFFRNLNTAEISYLENELGVKFRIND